MPSCSKHATATAIHLHKLLLRNHPTIPERKLKRDVTKFFRKALTSAIRSDTRSGNPLQPTAENVRILRGFATSGVLMAAGSNLMTATALKAVKSVLFEGKESKIPDQEMRATILAQKIADQVTTKGSCKVVLMDGHGRFFCCLSQALIRLLGKHIFDNKVVFLHVDLNKHVVAWKSALGLCSEQDNVYNYRPGEETVVYVNLCGPGGKEGVKALFEYLDSIDPLYLQNLMVSFAHIRSAVKGHWLNNPVSILKNANYASLGWQKGRERAWKAHLVAKSTQGFLTYTFKLKPAQLPVQLLGAAGDVAAA